MRHILIIDDQEDIRIVASLALETLAGWKVSTAESGAAGIQAAIRDRPDAILMDVMMPVMDGPSTFREMQSHEVLRHVPVLLLTAKVQQMDQRRFADLGVAGVLLKPFDPMRLADEISAVLGWI